MNTEEWRSYWWKWERHHILCKVTCNCDDWWSWNEWSMERKQARKQGRQLSKSASGKGGQTFPQGLSVCMFVCEGRSSSDFVRLSWIRPSSLNSWILFWAALHLLLSSCLCSLLPILSLLFSSLLDNIHHPIIHHSPHSWINEGMNEPTHIHDCEEEDHPHPPLHNRHHDHHSPTIHPSSSLSLSLAWLASFSLRNHTGDINWDMSILRALPSFSLAWSHLPHLFYNFFWWKRKTACD